MSTPGFVRLDDGTIHHVVAVHKDERYTLYADGAKVGSWVHLTNDATFEFRGNSGFASSNWGLTDEQIAEHNRAAEGEDDA